MDAEHFNRGWLQCVSLRGFRRTVYETRLFCCGRGRLYGYQRAGRTDVLFCGYGCNRSRRGKYRLYAGFGNYSYSLISADAPGRKRTRNSFVDCWNSRKLRFAEIKTDYLKRWEAPGGCCVHEGKLLPLCGQFLKLARTAESPQFPNISCTPVPASYEAFLFAVQLPSVDCTLPQDSADISNTDSNRKEGAVYGFFAGTGTVSRVLSLFD